MREDQEQLERLTLAAWATLAADSQGRQNPVAECPRRTCFQRDRDRSVHCKAFRRLGHKTQVFISPEGDHYADPYAGGGADCPHRGPKPAAE